MSARISTALVGFLCALLIGCEDGDGTPTQQTSQAGSQMSGTARLAAVRTVSKGSGSGLVTLRADGAGTRLVLGADERASIAFFHPPAWSPDGQRLAFTVETGAQSLGGDIFSVDVGSGTTKRLTRGGRSIHPVWSPDGKTIAFSRLAVDEQTSGGTASVWLMGSNGSHARPVTRPGRHAGDLPGSFSPDGRLVAFTRFAKDGTTNVQTVALDGSERRRLQSDGADPAYSPSGNQIAFTSDRDRNGELTTDPFSTPASELYLMDSDGTDALRLTTTEDIDERLPSWSSDAARLAFERVVDFQNTHSSSIFFINPDGTCGGRLDRFPGRNIDFSAPAWRPGSQPGMSTC